MISEEQIQEIKDKNRIEDVIREYVSLKASGSGFTGLCPFHPDKNPSMSIHTGKQIFRCWSCNVGGDVIHFIMKYHNLSYYEALKFLADRAGIKIREDDRELSQKDAIRKKITLANRDAAKYFYSCIVKAKAPREYLMKRGITGECVTKFGIGFAPDGFDNLVKDMEQKGYTKEFLETAGLAIRAKNGNYIDKFRNRIMIPIFDVNGNIIAFGGRVLDDSKPKYMNSAENDLYSKGNHLYGLNFARRSQNKQRVIMVEGYMDCISLQNRGIDNAVASLGTALTVNQAKLVKRYFEEVVLCYDSDEAGMTATERGIGILEAAGAKVKVMSVPDGKDPDEFLRKHSPEDFVKLADEADTSTEYRIKVLEKKYPADKMDTRAKFLERSVRVLAEIDDKTARDMYIQWFAEKYSLSKDSVVYDVNRQANTVRLEKNREEQNKAHAEQLQRERMNTVEGSGQNNEGSDNPEETNIPDYVKKISEFPGGSEQGKMLFNLEITVSLLYSEDVNCFKRFDGKISGKDFYYRETADLFEKLEKAAKEGRTNYGFGVLLEGASQEMASALVEREKETDITSDITAAVEELFKRIKRIRIDGEIAEIRKKIKLMTMSEEEKSIYMKKINDLLIEKRQIR